VKYEARFRWISMDPSTALWQDAYLYLMI